jgi:hypothetical protein
VPATLRNNYEDDMDEDLNISLKTYLSYLNIWESPLDVYLLDKEIDMYNYDEQLEDSQFYFNLIDEKIEDDSIEIKIFLQLQFISRYHNKLLII